MKEIAREGMWEWLHDESRWIDILGHYSPHWEVRHCCIHLYWVLIGKWSQLLGVSVEDLTVVVLAHELAHAFTHVGLDIDGRRWEFDDFINADRELKEGLAQYYTARVLQRWDQLEDAYHAYQRLLPGQPSPYQVHREWLDCFTPEEVRTAFLRVRRSDSPSYPLFQRYLQEAKVLLRH